MVIVSNNQIGLGSYTIISHTNPTTQKEPIKVLTSMLNLSRYESYRKWSNQQFVTRV